MIRARDSSVHARHIGAILLVTAGAFFTVEVTCVRLLGDGVGHGQILLFRSSTQFALAAAWVALAGGRTILRTERPWVHLLRGLLSAVSWWLYYLSFRSLDLALATTLSFSSQIFVLALAGPVLKEKITAPRMFATVLGFAGIACAVQVWNLTSINGAIIYGLASSLCGAVMVLITRSLSQTERTDVIMFFMGGIVFLAAIPEAYFTWTPLATYEIGLLCSVGLFGTAGTWLMIEAYRRAEASALAPFPYMRLIFSIVVGVLLFGDLLLPATMVGAALIVGSTLYIVTAEHRRAVKW